MTPEEIVKLAENAYNSQDIEKVKGLFHPDVVVYWDGKKILEGREQVVEFERNNFASMTDFHLKKTMRAASGDTIAVEWTGNFIDKESGKKFEMFGAEFWKLRDGLLFEWRAYLKDYEVDESSDS
jgi:nuclear transport factor 2 (NTF2) superfamily protein